jgi:predicted Ser/Thr protein kinase
VEGTPFGRYRLIDLLGRGGMGEVWKAFDTATERIVAVKVLSPQVANDPVFEQRFRREAHAAARLNDPHVVPIHNYGEIEGRLYVDMRLIDGRDLEEMLADGPLPPERAVKIVEQIASALNSAHRVGLVHRDVKPSNILVAEDDFAYLIDFGIARGTGETGLTATGNVIGTWPYMAPERFTTGLTDARSDIYALACVFYQTLTSSRPFPGDSVEQQIAGHLTAPPPRPSIAQPGMSPELDVVIATGMAKEPGERYGTTTDLARAARSALTAAGAGVAAPPDPAMHSAPTQARPADAAWAATQAASGEKWAPTQARPAERAPHPPAHDRLPWFRRTAIVVPIAVVVIMAAVVTILYTVMGNDAGTGTPAASTGFNGTYAVRFDSPTTPSGQPYEGAAGGDETWVVKSACGDTGCMASATKVNGTVSAAATLVLDQISGRWESVTATSGVCQDAPTEYWESMSLLPRPDGSLAGDFMARSTTTCARNQQVTFTRTGDPQAGVAVADPATQPARTGTPARGLHGRYREIDTYVDGNRRAEATFAVTSYCLRTGDRCLSYWDSPADVKNLVFAQRKWTLANTAGSATCTSGTQAGRQITLEYPLPPGAQDPIDVLTGRGHYTVTGACPYNSDFDSRVERIGD